MNADQSHLEKQPWYRNPMVWLVIFFPSLAVVGGIITIIIAVNTEDGLVVDEYYKKGLEINQVIKHDQMAQQLKVSTLVDANSQTGEIIVNLSGDESLDLPSQLSFKLIHRTRSGQDQVTTVSRLGDSNEYRGYIKPPIIEGRWTIIISVPDSWRIKKDFSTQQATHILLKISA